MNFDKKSARRLTQYLKARAESPDNDEFLLIEEGWKAGIEWYLEYLGGMGDDSGYVKKLKRKAKSVV